MDTLINFRIPEELKHKFQNLCMERKSTMTSEIVRFILDFVGNTPTTSKRLTCSQNGGCHAR